MRNLNLIKFIKALVPVVLIFDYASAVTNDKIPNPLRARSYQTVEDLILGRSCLSLRSSNMGLSCNPAALAGENRSQLRMNLIFDDHVSDVKESSENIDKNDRTALVNEIFGESKTLSAHGRVGGWYQNDWWALSLTPLRGALVTKTTNPAYPRIEAVVAKESEILFRSGYFLQSDDRFRFGADIRFVTREYLDKRLDLTEITANPDLIEIQSGKQLYVEPGFIYAFESAWKSELSLALANWTAFTSGEKVKGKAIFDIGLSSSPDFLNEKFRSTVHFSSDYALNDLGQRLRWSGLIVFSEQLSASFTLAGHEQGVGIMGSVDSVVLGAGFKNEKINPDSWQSESIKSFIFDMGLVF